MKIGINEINKGIYMVALEKLQRSLENDGFQVIIGKNEDMFDLFAERDDDRRIYEIKIGKNKAQKRQLSKLQEIAKEKKAKLFVTYLEQPRTSQIEYEGLEELLMNYLMDNMPDELDVLSTHTILENVYDLEINSIFVKNNIIKVEGSASLAVELQYGSTFDREDGMGDVMDDSYDFVFRVNIVEGSIEYAYFKFDVEHFYQ